MSLKKTIKYIDLFAGAGGLSEGFQRAGYEPVAHVEMDSDACNTLRTREAYYYLQSKGRRAAYLNYLSGTISRDQLYWGSKLPYCQKDLEYIESLPGRKILLRGNHDHFWDVKKTERLNEMFEGKLHFLQNNYFSYGDYALVGTKGYCFEGPFYVDAYGRIAGFDEKEAAHAAMLVERETGRLQKSFDAAMADGCRKFIMFLHYPPTNIMEQNSAFTKMAEEYHVDQVVYAHCHGEARFHDSIRGKKRGIRYSLVSGDCLRWKPMKVLP